jgi:hypothetical protein
MGQTGSHLKTMKALWEDIKQERAKARFWVEVFTLIAVIFYACIAYKQHATQIVSMQIDQRPWIISEDLEGHIWQPNPGDFYFIPTVANVGKSPAINLHVQFYYKIVPKVGDDFPFGKYSDAKLCNGISSGAFNPTPKGIRWPTMY